MKKNIALIFSSLAIASMVLFSCAREYPDRICESPYNVICGQDSAAINVRLINRSGYPLCDVAITWETTTGEIIKYGRMDVDDVSCYSVYNAPKVYPYLTFTLGNQNFAIKDSLKSDNKPYNTKLVEDPGFYTYYINISDSLLSGTCFTILNKH